jgi:DNA-binding PadR family transcriptional regulator
MSSAETTLLGLLSEQPMYPYQIEQEVKYRDMRFWTELSMSSIYKLLRKLEKNALVIRKNEISSENRMHTLYTLSDIGKKKLQEKLAFLLTEPEHVRWKIDIGIYNLNLLSDKQAKEALSKYRLALEKKIKEYEALLKFLQDSKCPSHRFGVATRPIFLLKGELKWIESYLRQLES